MDPKKEKRLVIHLDKIGNSNDQAAWLKANIHKEYFDKENSNDFIEESHNIGNNLPPNSSLIYEDTVANFLTKKSLSSFSDYAFEKFLSFFANGTNLGDLEYDVVDTFGEDDKKTYYTFPLFASIISKYKISETSSETFIRFYVANISGKDTIIFQIIDSKKPSPPVYNSSQNLP